MADEQKVAPKAEQTPEELEAMKFLTEKEKGRVVLMVKNMLRGISDPKKK
jgi:hypothetical protein